MKVFLNSEELSPNFEKLIKKYHKGDTIVHKTYGRAVIEEYSPPVCKIRLDNNEIHSVDIGFCLKNNYTKHSPVLSTFFNKTFL